MRVSADHPVNAWLERWAGDNAGRAQIDIIRSKKDLTNGDFLFLISCSELVREPDRSRYRHSIVIHASDLPRGRGWSPHVWDVLAGWTSWS